MGRWTGEGQHQGQAVQGSLEVEAILDGSWLRATETVVVLHDQSQTIDISYYRWNDQAESLQLFQLFEHGHLNTLLVEATEAGFQSQDPWHPSCTLKRHPLDSGTGLPSKAKQTPSLK